MNQQAEISTAGNVHTRSYCPELSLRQRCQLWIYQILLLVSSSVCLVSYYQVGEAEHSRQPDGYISHAYRGLFLDWYMLDHLPRKFRLNNPYVKHKLKLILTIETIAMPWGTMACSLL